MLLKQGFVKISYEYEAANIDYGYLILCNWNTVTQRTIIIIQYITIMLSLMAILIIQYITMYYRNDQNCT